MGVFLVIDLNPIHENDNEVDASPFLLDILYLGPLWSTAAVFGKSTELGPVK